MDYQEFLKNKQVYDKPTGLNQVPQLNKSLFDFQHDGPPWSSRFLTPFRPTPLVFANLGREFRLFRFLL